MTHVVFTLDYEIYGNGVGTLRKLVLEPTEKLAEVFAGFGAPLVIFAEALEFAKIEEAGSDADSTAVREQLRTLRARGHEIGLHLHPWWANAGFDGSRWHLDWAERNLATLPAERIETIVSDGIGYLRNALQDPEFRPVSFRAGQWLIQPAGTLAQVLARSGVLVDSSVFPGGRMRGLGLDYRPARVHHQPWRFTADVNADDPRGDLWEIPIHTQMVPFWQMLQRKRLLLQQRTRSASDGSPLARDWRDFVRLRYPRKLDFCRMNFGEMHQALGRVLAAGRSDDIVVAIGHSKDLVDASCVRLFLALLRECGVGVTTFTELLRKVPQFSQ